MSDQQVIDKLERELAEASNMVLLAMNSNSDLGHVVQFLKLAFAARTVEDLADMVRASLGAIGLKVSVWAETPAGFRVFNSEGVNEMKDAEFFQENSEGGRIVEIGRYALINHPKISILVHNMPQEAELRGRTRDMLSTAMEGIESRMEGLLAEHAAKEASRAKEEFYQIMSHELRTPLNAIIGFSDILQKRLSETVGEKDLSSLRLIETNGRKLHGLISNLLDLSTIEYGQLTIQKEQANLADILKRTIEYLTPQAQDHHVTIVNQTEGEMFGAFDVSRVAQVSRILVSNAISFAGGGEVVVRAWIEGEKLKFSVSDNGIGIDNKDHQQIFDRFKQLDSSKTRRKQGLGLELYLAKNIIQAHGGAIELQSTPGQGSTFTVVLPMGEATSLAVPVELNNPIPMKQVASDDMSSL